MWRDIFDVNAVCVARISGATDHPYALLEGGDVADMSLETLCALLGLSPQSTAEAIRLEAWGHSREEIVEDIAELRSKFTNREKVK